MLRMPTHSKWVPAEGAWRVKRSDNHQHWHWQQGSSLTDPLLPLSFSYFSRKKKTYGQHIWQRGSDQFVLIALAHATAPFIALHSTTMDQSGHYSSSSSSSSSGQQRLFQSSQLPPPSQLHLATSFSRNNTLPPISHLPAAQRYPPPTYSHPSLSNTLPPPSLSSPPHLPWATTTHRTSSSRDEISPPLRHSDSRSKYLERDSPREPPTPRQPDPPPQIQQSVKNEAAEDNMPSTSDFVKKLYK